MTMTAAGAVDVTCPLLTGSRPGSRRLRPRPGGGRGRTPTVSEIRYGWTVGAYPTGDRVTAVGVRAREPQRRSCYAAPPPGFEPGPQGSKGLRAAATPGRKDASRPGPDGEGRDAGTVSHVPVALGTLRGGSARPGRARLRPGRLQDRTWHRASHLCGAYATLLGLRSQLGGQGRMGACPVPPPLPLPPPASRQRCDSSSSTGCAGWPPSSCSSTTPWRPSLRLRRSGRGPAPCPPAPSTGSSPRVPSTCCGRAMRPSSSSSSCPEWP